MILLSDRSTGAGKTTILRETASVIELTVHVISHLSSLQTRDNDEESGARVNVRGENSSKELVSFSLLAFV